MDFGSSLPFAPHLYELRISQPVSTGTAFRILGLDSKRVYLKIARLSGPIAPGAYYSINQVGGADGRFIPNANNEIELNFAIHSMLTTAEIWSNGFGGGTVFSVIEVLYNLPNSRGISNDTKKLRSLSDKIKDFVFSSGSIGGSNNARSAVKST